MEPTGGASLYSPSFKGLITNNGQPVSDANLILSPVETVNSNCYFEIKQTRSDESGRFEFSAITKKEAGANALESERKWQICVKSETGNRSIWFDSIVGFVTVGPPTELRCELSKTLSKGLSCEKTAAEH